MFFIATSLLERAALRVELPAAATVVGMRTTRDSNREGLHAQTVEGSHCCPLLLVAHLKNLNVLGLPTLRATLHVEANLLAFLQ